MSAMELSEWEGSSTKRSESTALWRPWHRVNLSIVRVEKKKGTQHESMTR